MEFGFEPVCDQLRTSFEPASVIEFGFYPRDDHHCSDVVYWRAGDNVLKIKYLAGVPNNVDIA